jgi:hypothetical protein
MRSEGLRELGQVAGQKLERYVSTIFFVDPAKILRLWELGRGDLLFAGQSIDSMRVAGKILRNKELGGKICSIPGWGWNEGWTSYELGLGRTIPSLRLGKSRSRLFVTIGGFISVESGGKRKVEVDGSGTCR